MRFGLELGLLAVALTAAIYVPMSIETRYRYWTWLGSISFTTFVFYGLDKFLARFQRLQVRVPELVLNLMTLAGGFPGAWVGRFLFRHKTNIRKHPTMFVVLVLATVFHLSGLYLWLHFFSR